MLALSLIRIAVVCGDRSLGDSLVHYFSAQPGFTITPFLTSPTALLTAIAGPYDVVLVDAGEHALWFADTPLPDRVPVIVVGAPDDDRWAALALSDGARGIVTAAGTPEDVLGAIQVVHDGGIWARRRWLNACVRHVVGRSRQRFAAQDLLDKRLSRREREVLRHAATGVGNKELADRLSISEATVKAHLTRIFQKLGVTGRAALAANYHDVANAAVNDAARS